MRTLGRWVGLGAIAFNLAACGGAATGALEDEDINSVDEGKYEAWNQADNPAYVDNSFVYEIGALPLDGKAATDPWPGDYWATANDSINHRWDGSNPSPAEKAEQALSLPGFATAVTNNFGIYGSNTKACTTSADCSSLNDGSACEFPRDVTGAGKGRCIPGWWGICHGWTPAALAEPAPRNPVTKNGVTFYPGDLEGLMSLVYSTNLPTKFLSERCNKENPATDEHGRVVDGPCRGTNPGSVHVVLSNFLGLRHQGIAEDRTYDIQVWNQPIRSWKVTNAVAGKIPEITKADAVAMLGLAQLSFSPLLAATDITKDTLKTGEYLSTAGGQVVVKMAGGGDADLYVKAGSAPTTTTYDCRPYAGNSTEECRVSVAAGQKVYWMINGYAPTSTGVSLQVGVAQGTPNYVYNTSAARFFYVEADVNYISESSPARESHISSIDSYTQKDHYQYILETDANGRIQGGEWVGGSQTKHPDFLWWPNGKPSGTLPGGLTYAQVKALNDESAGVSGGGGGTGGSSTTTLLDNVALHGVSSYATIGVTGGKKLVVTMTGSDNADLYIRLGAKPTTTVYTARSTGSTSSESVTVTAPAAGGTYYVRARPVGGSPTVTVTAVVQ